jgi:DNA modification methylase
MDRRRSEERLRTAARSDADDARERFHVAQLHHLAQPARLRHAEKLDERASGTALLHERLTRVWIDVQQVFYRMEENVNGCYAQKPLKAIKRIIEASSSPGDTALDFFSHSGTTILAAEMTGRRCLAMDIDPIFCEITIRRLENFRLSRRTGWQNSNPFARELGQMGSGESVVDGG